MYNAARCYEFCAHFLGSQKSPKIQTAPDSGTFRVSYTNTRITAVCQKKKTEWHANSRLLQQHFAKNCKQATASRGAPARGLGPPPV